MAATFAAKWDSRTRGGVGQPHSRRCGTAALAAVRRRSSPRSSHARAGVRRRLDPHCSALGSMKSADQPSDLGLAWHPSTTATEMTMSMQGGPQDQMPQGAPPQDSPSPPNLAPPLRCPLCAGVDFRSEVLRASGEHGVLHYLDLRVSARCRYTYTFYRG